MVRKITLVCGIFLLAATLAFAYCYDRLDLERAHRLKERGNHFEAREQFVNLARYSSNYDVQAEAAYFVGFCDIKMGEYWKAIEEYRFFIDKFGRWNSRFVADAMYVLGRTYENVRDFRNARRWYNECIDRYPYDEFASKSRDRLRYIGGGYGGGYNFSMDQAGKATKKATPKSTKALNGAPKEKLVDPFDSHKLDSEKIERISAFIEAVENSKDVEKAMKKLTAQDKEQKIVKEKMKVAEEKAKFNKLQEK